MITLTHQGKDYTLVEDFLSIDNKAIDSSHFVSCRLTINDREYQFINAYASVDLKNPVGIWQTILTNHDAFDYKKDFKYQFKIDDRVFLISHSVENGISIHNNIESIDIDEFEAINVDFSNFKRFDILKTQSQERAERNKTIKKNIVVNLIVWITLVSGVFFFYQRSSTDFDKTNQMLSGLKSQVSGLQSEINNTLENTIKNDVRYQQAHIKRLFLFLDNGIEIKKASFDLSKSQGNITVDFDAIETVKYIAKINHFTIEIDRHFKDVMANVSWTVELKHHDS